MNKENAQTTWTELKGKIKQKWDKFADADVDAFQDKLHLIPEKLQSSYGYTKDKADQEYAEFKKTLAPTVSPDEKAKPN